MLGQVQQYLKANNLPIDTPSYLVYKGIGTDGYVAAATNALHMLPKVGQPYTVPYSAITSFSIKTGFGHLPALTLQITGGQPLSFAVQDLNLEFSKDSTSVVQSTESFTSLLSSHGVISQPSGSQPVQTSPAPQMQVPQTPSSILQPPAVAPQPVAATPQPYVQTQPVIPSVQPPTPESTQGPQGQTPSL